VQTDELQLKLADATAAEHELRAALDEATAAADGLRGEVTGLKQKVVAFEELATKARKDVTFGENGERGGARFEKLGKGVRRCLAVGEEGSS
jgi:hypothetical protein